MEEVGAGFLSDENKTLLLKTTFVLSNLRFYETVETKTMCIAHTPLSLSASIIWPKSITAIVDIVIVCWLFKW